MTAIEQYLEEIKTKLLLSRIVASLSISSERTFLNRGYFRARLRLSNGDFLEVSEYFILQAGQCVTQEYRYQWMDASQKQLIKRWDNAEHFPGLPHFPHHSHIGSETNVVPGTCLSIIQLLSLIEAEF